MSFRLGIEGSNFPKSTGPPPGVGMNFTGPKIRASKVVVHAANALTHSSFLTDVTTHDGITRNRSGKIIGIGFVECAGGIIESIGVQYRPAGEQIIPGLAYNIVTEFVINDIAIVGEVRVGALKEKDAAVFKPQKGGDRAGGGKERIRYAGKGGFRGLG